MPTIPEPEDPSSVLVIQPGDPALYRARPTLPDEQAHSAGRTASGSLAIISQWFDGGWWWWDDSCAFHIDADARIVSVYPDPTADEETIGSVLMGPVARFILCQRGYPTLHASAIAVGGEAIAFAGAKGQGKSTLASLFVRRGATLLTDDVLPIVVGPDGIFGAPGPVRLKVEHDVAREVLGLDPDQIPTVAPNRPKKLLTATELPASIGGPVRLRAVYLIERYDAAESTSPQITSTQIPAYEALVSIVPHMNFAPFLAPAVMGRVLPALGQMLSQVPVRRLRYPNGFDQGDIVCSSILKELGLHELGIHEVSWS